MVDNGSVDGSVEYVKKNFPWVKILALDKNYGFTGGNNRGAGMATGDLLVFLNNDTVVNKHWLDELVKVILSDDKIGVCGSKIVFMDKPDIVQYSGGFLHLLGGTVFCPFHGDNPRRNFYLVGSICGASFLIKRNIFEDVGGFDEDFFAYSDENDLCLRVWIYGYSVSYCPHSVVYHFAGGTSRKSDVFQFNDILSARLISPLTIYHGNKNSMAILIKNFQAINLLTGLVFSYLYLFFQLILLLRNKRGEVKLLIKAGAWPLWNLKTIWKKRVIIQRRRKVSDNWLIRNELLLSIGNTLKLVMQLRR
jgi:GT2 family glycosyltransferase